MKPRVWWTKTGIGQWWWACWLTDQHPARLRWEAEA